MANKKSLMMMLMMAFLLLTSISVSAKQPTDINLEAGYVDPEDEGGDPHRSPILIPEVGIDNYTLTFYTPCDGCTLRLLDENDNIAFVTMIPVGSTTLVLPSYLSGTYQIQIISGNICFWGNINL
jgi:hypothetical protein